MKHDPQYTVAAYGCFIWAKKHFDTFLIGNPDYDLRRDFPQRKPLAGWYDDTQEAFDKHLQAMADCALDVMVIDWYPVHAITEEKDKAVYDRALNNGTQFFMNSKLNVNVKFCLSLINHEPFAMKNDRDWETSIDLWIKAFKHPRYWKIDGKPVFTLHSSWHLDRHEGSPEKSGQRLATLRKRAKQAGIPGLLLGAGINNLSKDPGINKWLKTHGYDFITFYNKPNWEPYKEQLNKEKDFILPYRKLMDAHFAEWAKYPKQNITLPFSPFLTAQWEPKPWWGSSPAHTMRYQEPTDDEFREFFNHAKKIMDESTYYRIPTKDGKGVKAIFICAWNELAEGSIICPTVEHGNKRMKIINQVFQNK
ncbi:MAG: glycoside hydrolase family 99-like domain-containing protein [Planctomycetota bacterium]|jgi:hypothetical protein